MAMALGLAEALKELLHPVLMTLRGPDPAAAVVALQPQAGDAAKAFVGPAAALATEVYDAFWRAPPPFPRPDAERSELVIHLAPAGMLGEDNLLSRPFPGGYRVLAPFMDPHRIWAAWEFVRPGARDGLAFDGLVWCDDHWAWFPRPYQMLGPKLAG